MLILSHSISNTIMVRMKLIVPRPNQNLSGNRTIALPVITENKFDIEKLKKEQLQDESLTTYKKGADKGEKGYE